MEQFLTTQSVASSVSAFDGTNHRKWPLHVGYSVLPAHKKGSQSLAANSRFTRPRKTLFQQLTAAQVRLPFWSQISPPQN